MRNLSVSVPHRLSQYEALKRVQRSIAHFAAQHSDKAEVQQSWTGYTGTFVVSNRGQQAPATITVNPSDVTVQATLPLLAIVEKSRIEDTIRDVLTKVLAQTL